MTDVTRASVSFTQGNPMTGARWRESLRTGRAIRFGGYPALRGTAIDGREARDAETVMRLRLVVPRGVLGRSR